LYGDVIVAQPLYNPEKTTIKKPLQGATTRANLKGLILKD
jgi:hypothetical protein